MKFQVNSQDKSNYLENLNTCFSNWGNMDTFNWVFNRTLNNRKADLFTISTDDGVLLAGSAVTYRTIRNPAGGEFEVGIMTGSWTLPTSRGLGCFSRAIEKSAEIVAGKEIPFLSAFVTESNASYRRLRDAGSFLIKTQYIVSEKQYGISRLDNKGAVEVLPKTDENIANFFQRRKILLKDKPHFSYSVEEFEDQFIRRLHPTFLLALDSELAIVEETASNFQIHFCSDYSPRTLDMLVKWAYHYNKEIFFFLTQNSDAFKDTSGFKVIPGFFTVLKSGFPFPLTEEDLSDIHIEYGDKM